MPIRRTDRVVKLANGAMRPYSKTYFRYSGVNKDKNKRSLAYLRLVLKLTLN